MPKPISTGTLLYRTVNGELEVLLVHPSGNYNRKAPWSIPKGLPDDEEPLETAARRETVEETGVEAGELVLLGSIEYTKSRKTVTAFAGPAPVSAAPHAASWEVDRAEFVPIAKAAEIIHPDQRSLLEKLVQLIASKTMSE